MAQIGTLRLQTATGIVSVPVYQPADIGSGVYDIWRVNTPSGVGVVPLASTADAAYPYLRIKTQNYGTLAVHNSTSTVQVIAETGRASLTNTIDGGVSVNVSFSYSYSNPVVIAYIPTRNGGQSVGVRVRNVSSTGFNVFMEEPDNQGHNGETVCWMVCEAGTWTTPDGWHLQAGTVSTSSVHRAGEAPAGPTVSLSGFSSAPAVLHTLNTYANGAFMETVAHNVTSTSFQVEQEAAHTGIAVSTETIGWIAAETGSGATNGYTWEANWASDGSGDGVDNTAHNINWVQSHASTPDVLVKQQTLNGTDGSWARGAGLQWDTAGHDVYAEEDQVGDTERGHTDETFGWLAIEPNAVIQA